MTITLRTTTEGIKKYGPKLIHAVFFYPANVNMIQCPDKILSLVRKVKTCIYLCSVISICIWTIVFVNLWTKFGMFAHSGTSGIWQHSNDYHKLLSIIILHTFQIWHPIENSRVV